MSISIEPNTCKVAILAGGKSGEREISLKSGNGAKEALEKAGFQVALLDPANKEDLHTLIDGNFDVAFIALHGRYGEDGTMQGFLDIIGLPYVGSGVWASAVSIDKAKAKVFYERSGLLTPPSLLMKKEEVLSKGAVQESSCISLDVEKVVQQIGLPCVVKPASEGSALGVFIIESEEELSGALCSAFEMDHDVLIEKYIAGTELTVAVLGNSTPEALPVIEIIPTNDFYDFESKYAPGGSQHICPAQIKEEDTNRAQDMAVRAHLALGCKGMSRSDFILDGRGDIWLLETNTIPGMTETSLLPDAGRVAGMDFSELCTKLVAYALEEASAR